MGTTPANEDPQSVCQLINSQKMCEEVLLNAEPRSKFEATGFTDTLIRLSSQGPDGLGILPSSANYVLELRIAPAKIRLVIAFAVFFGL